MGRSRVPTAILALLAVLAIVLVPPVQAGEHADSYLVEDVYTEEQTTTNRDVLLEGDTVLEAWFNFTVLEDKIQSRPDSFLFAVSNVDDPALTQNLPGTTDTQGELHVPIHFTLEGAPRWRVSVTCNDAGDTMGPLGQTVLEKDAGNAWSLQVEYLYWIDEGVNGGNGGNGGGTSGDEEVPTLVTVMDLDLVAVALVSLLVAFLAVGVALRGEGRLKLPMVISGILALDAFVLLPVALVVNLELNDASFAMPPYGPEWLGNLALVLLLIWVAPFIVARKRVLASEEVRGLIGRLTARSVADQVKRRADRYPTDPLSDRMMAVLMVGIGVGSVVVVAMMLLGGA